MPVKGQKTGEGDYTIELNLKDEADNVIWIEGSDGYYYYIRPVAVGASTATLITRCIDNGTAPAGYGLNVEILGSAIQSVPAYVVEQNWKVVTVSDDGTLTAG